MLTAGKFAALLGPGLEMLLRNNLVWYSPLLMQVGRDEIVGRSHKAIKRHFRTLEGLSEGSRTQALEGPWHVISSRYKLEPKSAKNLTILWIIVDYGNTKHQYNTKNYSNVHKINNQVDPKIHSSEVVALCVYDDGMWKRIATAC